MADQSFNELKTPEPSKQFPNVRVEHGDHLVGPQEEEAYKAFLKGDTRSHFWKPEIGQRLSSQGFSVLAIEGISPYITKGGEDISVEEKAYAWLCLPDRAGYLNSKGLFVVGGDIFGLASPFTHPQLYRSGEGVQVALELDKQFVRNSKDEADLIADKSMIQAMGGLIGVSIGIASAASSLTPENMSRRRFLRIAGAGAAGVGLASGEITNAARNFLLDQLGKSRNSDAHQIYSAALEHVRPIFVRSEVAHARSALIIEKLLGAMNLYNMPEQTKAAVVLGLKHAFESNILLENQDERHKAIAQFARVLLRSVDSLIDEKAPQVDKDLAHRILLNYLATTDILKVRDTGEPDINPQLPQRIGDLVHLQARFHSPGVKEALQPLYPKDV